MTEPRVESETLLETKENLGFYPMTVARYALLDALSSPFLTKETKMNMLTVLPTRFVMTQDIETLSKYNIGNLNQLISDALKQAEEDKSLTGEVITDFTKKLMKHLYGIDVLLPEKNEESNKTSKGKKAQTAS